MKKKALVLLLSAFLLASFFACGKPVSKEKKEGKVKAEKVEKTKKTEAKKPSGPPAFKYTKLNLRGKGQRRRAKPDETYKVPVPEINPVKGGKASEALVTIVEFSEFQCPFCARVIDTLYKLLDEYKNQIRIVFRHNPLPFHPHAEMLSVAAGVVQKLGGTEAFWKFHDLLFHNQKQWTRLDQAAVTHKVIEYVKQVGVNVDQFKKMMENPPKDIIEMIKRDLDDAVRFGANGTPTFFLNGRYFSGARPYDQFKKKIDELIKEAEKFKGKPDIYAEIVKDGKTEAAPPPPPKVDKTIYKINIPEGAHKKGATKPKVVLIEFSDYQCPFSKRVQPTLRKLLEEYPKDVVRYFAHNPLSFHKNAMMAAVAAEAAAEQGKFWEMSDLLFEKQSEWNRLSGDELKAKFEEIAKQAGVKNLKKFRAALDNPKPYEEKIKKMQAYGNKYGARGTPTVFINGRRVAGAYPYESFKTAVEEEIKRANELLKKGVSYKKLYAELIKNGKEKYEAPKRPSQGLDFYEFKPADLKGAPMKGSKNAPVTIVEFSDFQCPFCRRVEDTLHKLMNEYKGKIKLYWKHLPLGFHKYAKITAVASIAAQDQGKFWEYHDVLYNKYNEWVRLPSEDDVKKKLIEYAKEVGLNLKKFEQALNNASAYDSIINKDLELARKLGARGTPTFFINGKKFVGAQPYENFKREIDAALEKAKKK